MRIVICDDHKDDVKHLRSLISDHPAAGSFKIEAFFSGTELAESINKKQKYDVAILDIDLPGTNGIELGKLLRASNPDVHIVFATNYPQYAIDAYDCEAFHYLLKPVADDKLRTVLDRLVRKHRERNKYHVVRIKNETLRIPIREIYYIESFRKHIIYHLKDKKYETVGKLSEVMDELLEYGFCQVHQGYVVNMDKIKDFNKFELILDDGRCVTMSVRKRTEVLIEYAKFVERSV